MQLVKDVPTKVLSNAVCGAIIKAEPAANIVYTNVNTGVALTGNTLYTKLFTYTEKAILNSKNPVDIYLLSNENTHIFIEGS